MTWFKRAIRFRGERRRFRFPRACLISLSFFLLVIGGLFYSLSNSYSEDKAAYDKLIYGEQEKKQENSYTSKQLRNYLQKDIYFNKQDKHLQMRLQSQQAELTFDRYEGNFEFVEKMQKMTCLLQEELFFVNLDDEAVSVTNEVIKEKTPPLKAKQKLLFLKAETATYYYNKGLLIAENVYLSRYISSGHSLEEASFKESDLITGVAEVVECSFERTPSVKLQKFRAEL